MITQMIGEQIKSLRKKRKLTQQQLADLTGVHRITITQLENSHWAVSVITLEKIANALEADWSIRLRERTPKPWPYPRLRNPTI